MLVEKALKKPLDYFHIKELTYIERVSHAFQTTYPQRAILLEITYLKNLCIGIIKVCLLSKRIACYLCPNDTLGITVRTKSNFVKKQPPEGPFVNLGIGTSALELELELELILQTPLFPVP